MKRTFIFNLKVWSFGIVLDFEYLYFGLGLGPFVFRIGWVDRPAVKVHNW